MGVVFKLSNNTVAGALKAWLNPPTGVEQESRHCVDRSLLLLTLTTDGCSCNGWGDGDEEEEEEGPQSRTKKRRISRAERAAASACLAVGDFITPLARSVREAEREWGWNVIVCAVDDTSCSF